VTHISSPGVGRFLGMDEAGYGPNLGPLLITGTVWETPGAPTECDFYRLLGPVVSAAGHGRGRQLHIADSKLVNVGKEGFASLERSALALLACLGDPCRTFQELWQHVAFDGNADHLQAFHVGLPEWYRRNCTLPVKADPVQVAAFSRQLQARMQETGVRLLAVESDLVPESRFNALLAEPSGNKGRALSRLAFRLLRRMWNPADRFPTVIVGDKHGGRNRYDQLLAEVLDGEMIFRLEEQQAISRYQVGQTEIRFQVQGESHLPVACASIISKYLRELCMDLFNMFWADHCPGVRPTRGYPLDARRFRGDVEAMREQLGISELDFWRQK